MVLAVLILPSPILDNLLADRARQFAVGRRSQHFAASGATTYSVAPATSTEKSAIG